jgi:hypothetical protein
MAGGVIVTDGPFWGWWWRAYNRESNRKLLQKKALCVFDQVNSTQMAGF